MIHVDIKFNPIKFLSKLDFFNSLLLFLLERMDIKLFNKKTLLIKDSLTNFCFREILFSEIFDNFIKVLHYNDFSIFENFCVIKNNEFEKFFINVKNFTFLEKVEFDFNLIELIDCIVNKKSGKIIKFEEFHNYNLIPFVY